MLSFSGVCYVCFVFGCLSVIVFMLSLKPRPFVLSFFDIHAPRQSHTIVTTVPCSYRVMNVRRSYLRIRFNTSWTNHVRACGEV